ncbi:MAG: family metallo-hydrolase, partial [Chitinophagaceae bacterium]|nr:family metallo-hydrolase [Chitinophagaceae bacterium]
MILLRLKFGFIFLLTTFLIHAQKLKKADKAIIANLQKHISYLADDKLEGRRVGTAGEALAMDYIRSEFEQIGLTPKGNDGFAQSFEINDGKQVDSTTYFFIKGKELKQAKDFFPFAFSADATI